MLQSAIFSVQNEDQWHTRKRSLNDDAKVFLFASLFLLATKKSKMKKQKKTGIAGLIFYMAETVGFEPTSPCRLPDFESGSL